MNYTAIYDVIINKVCAYRQRSASAILDCHPRLFVYPRPELLHSDKEAYIYVYY